MKTALYRHYDAANRLLYVGISLSQSSRLEQHMQDSKWAADIATIKIEYFSSRNEAFHAEKTAIQAEYPIWNLQHNRERAWRLIQDKAPDAIFPTEIGNVACFNGTYHIINGRLIQEETGLPMHADQANIRQGSISANGQITYFD